jgi:hypothetical protein
MMRWFDDVMVGWLWIACSARQRGWLSRSVCCCCRRHVCLELFQCPALPPRQALDSVLSLLGKSEACDRSLVAQIYAMTLARLKQTNQSLWFRFSYSLVRRLPRSFLI